MAENRKIESDIKEKLVSRASQDFESKFTENIVVEKYLRFFEKVIR